MARDEERFEQVIKSETELPILAKYFPLEKLKEVDSRAKSWPSAKEKTGTEFVRRLVEENDDILEDDWVEREFVKIVTDEKDRKSVARLSDRRAIARFNYLLGINELAPLKHTNEEDIYPLRLWKAVRTGGTLYQYFTRKNVATAAPKKNGRNKRRSKIDELLGLSPKKSKPSEPSNTSPPAPALLSSSESPPTVSTSFSSMPEESSLAMPSESVLRREVSKAIDTLSSELKAVKAEVSALKSQLETANARISTQNLAIKKLEELSSARDLPPVRV